MFFFFFFFSRLFVPRRVNLTEYEIRRLRVIFFFLLELRLIKTCTKVYIYRVDKGFRGGVTPALSLNRNFQQEQVQVFS